jgi:hypothetical protein
MCAVDDLAGLDRLDRQLNAQRGKRRLLLLWLDAYPPGFLLTDVLWAWWAFKGNAGRTILGAAAVALLAAIPMVFVMSGLHSLRTGQMRRKPGKIWPRLSWRSFALWFLTGSVVALYFVVVADNQYGRPHPAPLTASWLWTVMGAGCLALLFAEDHYAKQVAKRRAPRQGHAPADIHSRRLWPMPDPACRCREPPPCQPARPSHATGDSRPRTHAPHDRFSSGQQAWSWSMQMSWPSPNGSGRIFSRQPGFPPGSDAASPRIKMPGSA